MSGVKVTIFTALAVAIGLCAFPKVASAHYDSITQRASCNGYVIKADYSGGSQKRKVEWDVDVTIDGIREKISGSWTGISHGFNIFNRSGVASSVTATGTVTMYEQKEVCEWKWKWNQHKHKNEWVKDCTTKWQQVDEDEFDLDFNKTCVQPTATPVCTPTPTPTAGPTATPVVTPDPTPSPTQAPTFDASPEKQSKMSVADPTCTNNNMDSSIELFKNGSPVAGVNVKFIYENESKYAKTEANGRAGVMYGFKTTSDIIIEPEDGYPAQRQQAHALPNNCPVVATTPQVLGLADTGVFEDTLATIAGVFGTLSTAIGSILYVKKSPIKKSAKRKNK